MNPKNYPFISMKFRLGDLTKLLVSDKNSSLYEIDLTDKLNPIQKKIYPIEETNEKKDFLKGNIQAFDTGIFHDINEEE